jgi:FkbM family methyltransferase
MTSKVIPQSSVIVDIGCHIGTYSLPLAKQGHSLIAIDGSIDSISCLEEAKERNNIENITALNKIISNEEKVCTFNPKSSPYSAINDEIGREYWRNRNYIQSSTTIDQLFSSRLSDIDRCDMIKIDIEGYEQEAIEGSVDTITKYKPLLLLEINNLSLYNRQIKPNAVFSKLAELGYDILMPRFSLDFPPVTPNPLSSYIEFIPVDPDDIFPFRVANILCFPKGKKPSGITLSPMRSTEHLYQILKENYTPRGPFSSYFRSLIHEENEHNPFTNPK